MIEIKMILSIPKTTSIKIRVRSEIQISGCKKISMFSRFGLKDTKVIK
jgi:hypothetical protein